LILELLWSISLSMAIVPTSFYILFMRKVARDKPWNVKTDSNYEPPLSIIIPTYEEAGSIVRKLDNVREVDYPKSKIDVTVVDSASKDDTLELVSRWVKEHPEIKTQIVREKERRGMVPALNHGLKYLSGEVVVKTDTDCYWRKDSLRNAVKYLADPRVGAVAGLNTLHTSRETATIKTERTYRSFYNWLRIGESKLLSSLLYEGELMLLQRKVIEKIGFDETVGADDLPTAIRLIENGHRAIVADDAFYVEQTPYSWKEKFRQKIRRGRHILQALWKYKYVVLKGKTVFHRFIYPFEAYIYIVVPLLTVPLLALSIAIMVRYPWFILLSLLLLIGPVREMFLTFIVDNGIMLLAVLMELTGKEKVTWQKSDEIRESPTRVSDGSLK
jgi:biofilm PGA synthesis N-glycosyltransferase PgaC